MRLQQEANAHINKKYNKFNINNIIKIGTTIYINSIEFTKQQTKNYIDTLNYSNINNNNIKNIINNI